MTRSTGCGITIDTRTECMGRDLDTAVPQERNLMLSRGAA